MFDDDFFDEDDSPKDELLHEYTRIRDGESTRMLSEDEYEWIITYYTIETQYDEALLAAEIAQTYYPFSANILCMKAGSLSRAQKYGQALLVLDELEQIDQHHLDGTLLRADILSFQERPDLAAQWLEEQRHHFSGKEQVQLMLELAETYDVAEKFEDVWRILKEVLTLHPSNEEALHKISFWAEFVGKHEESILLHQEITDEDPYNALAWFNLGTAYQGKKLYEKAVDAYEYCLAIDDKFEFAYRNLAESAIRLRWYQKALEALETHLELASPEDVIFEAMGHCWEKKKDLSKARFYYRKASALNPSDDNMYYRIGETYFHEQQWEKAAKCFGTAIELNHTNPHYFMALGNSVMEMDRSDQALKFYTQALNLRPQNKTFWITYIRGLYRARRFEEAYNELDLAIDHTGDHSDYDYLKAALLIEMGKSKSALGFLEKALSARPRRLKLFTDLNPEFLRRKGVTDLISHYKKKKIDRKS